MQNRKPERTFGAMELKSEAEINRLSLRHAEALTPASGESRGE